MFYHQKVARVRVFAGIQNFALRARHSLGIWGSPVSGNIGVTAVTKTIREHGSKIAYSSHAQHTVRPLVVPRPCVGGVK